MTQIKIDITPVAHQHFVKLLAQENETNNLRIFATNPGSINADIGICFCGPGDELIDDLKIDFSDYILYIDKKSANALHEAIIDYEFDSAGGQLEIKAPNLKGKTPEDNAPLFDKIAFLIETEINPSLAMHRGRVELVEVTANNVIKLKFGGGCQGCGMADVTLKQGIEKNLKHKFPQITAIEDITVHTEGKDPYYVSQGCD